MIQNLLFLAGLVLILYALQMIYLPAAVAATGVVLCLVGVNLQKKKEGHK